MDVSTDGLTAKVRAAAGPVCSRADVTAALTAAGVVAGFDENAIDGFAARLLDPAFRGEAVLAHGRAARPGEPCQVGYTIELAQVPGEIQRDGHIDFHERHLLHPVEVGQVVARLAPATAGEAGCDVRGRHLPAAAGPSCRIRCGPGVRVDGDDVVATRAGVLLHDGDRLDVVPLYVHKGDVDLRSGNLRGEGSIEVRGDVGAGFVVAASADVVVHGSVFEATVEAGANVRITQGAMGGSTVVAAGDLQCRHAVAASLTAGRELTVQDQLMHCRARAERIVMTTGRAHAIGCELRARTSIVVGTAGNADGAGAVLAAADLGDARAALALLQGDAARNARSAARVDAWRQSRIKGNRLAQRDKDQTETERLRLLARQRELLGTATITVTGVAHAGVLIQFGEFGIVLDQPRRAVRFRYDRPNDRIHEENLP